MNPIVRALAIAALLAAAACAELPRAPAGGFEFELAGRFAARYRDEAASGLIAWRHHALRDEVLLSSPFGQGVAQITREREAVTLIASDSRRYAAADAEQLTEEVLGFRLPLRGLADWVRARPSGEAQSEAQRAPDGRLQVLRQDGWRIEYLEYDGEQPKVLKLNYPGLELRLAIREWK